MWRPNVSARRSRQYAAAHPLSRAVFGSDRVLAQGDRETALDARASHQRLVPALDVGKVRQIYLMALVPPRPAEDREIGNRDVASRELHFAEPLVEHAVEPPRLFRIALQAVAPVLLVGDLQEMVDLAGHRTKAAHLPHQPFQHRDLAPHIGGPKFAGLLAEIN